MAKDDARVLKTGKPIIDKIERATRPDGIDNYVSTTKIPRFNAKGEIVGLIGITRDITRRMQLERLGEEKEKIKKKVQLLEELNSAKSEFISVVSHELRTPLAIIKEAVMLISDGIAGPINDKQRQLLSKASHGAETLKGIIEELLDISRIESGKLKLHYSLVNLTDLLMDDSEFFLGRAKEKAVGLKYEFPPESMNLFMDAEKINRVITNLINNAIRFTEADGTIKLEVKIFENKIRVGVIDTGIGIAKDDLEKIFNKFVQVSGQSSFERQGLGLGLSISKGLIQQHGGEIWVESKLGVGSKFYFTLPYSYRVNMLEKQTRLRINNLINKGVNFYLVNLLIIHYAVLKKTMKVSPGVLFKDLKSIIDNIIKESNRSDKEKAQLISIDTNNGEASIIFPELGEHEITQLCNLLKGRLRDYFLKVKADNVFINVGLLAYPQHEDQWKEELPASLQVKKIYIGQEIRRFKRFFYKLNIKLMFADAAPYSLQTVDISQGGVCLVSSKLFETDARVNIKLELKEGSLPLHLGGRVAWIKAAFAGKYKIGIEFIHLKPKEKQILSRFISSITKKA